MTDSISRLDFMPFIVSQESKTILTQKYNEIPHLNNCFRPLSTLLLHKVIPDVFPASSIALISASYMLFFSAPRRRLSKREFFRVDVLY
jgi:hypothetical protein